MSRTRPGSRKSTGTPVMTIMQLNFRDTDGRTPLHRAAAEGLSHRCKDFIRMGADISIKDNDQHTALDLAILKNDRYVAILFCPSRLYRNRPVVMATEELNLQDTKSQ
jgi:ankyrin repeat protein